MTTLIIRLTLYSFILTTGFSRLESAPVKWTGGDGDWSDSASWEGGAVPSGAQAAGIDNGAPVLIGDKASSVQALSIDGKSAVTVGPVGDIKIEFGSGDKSSEPSVLAIGNKVAGMLQIRGGRVAVDGAVTGGGHEDAICKLLVTDGGSLTASGFSGFSGVSTVQIGPEAVLSTTGEQSVFGDGEDAKMNFQLAGGRLVTAGKDHWGAGRSAWRTTGGAYENSGGLFLASAEKSFFKGEISGESAIRCKSVFELAAGEASTALLVQSGGTFTAKKSFRIATAAKSRGSYRISAGELIADEITLGAGGNGLAELQTIGFDPKIQVQTISCRGTVALSFVTGLNSIAALQVPTYLDLRAADKAILKVDLRLRHKQGVLTLIKSPRINGKFTHVEISAKGVPMEAVKTENLAIGSYRLAYGDRGLEIHYRLPKK